jgi:TrmH family RNA methyltransferase
MLSKNQAKYIQSLHHKKFRLESGHFIAEGEKVVEELLESTFTVESIFATPEWFNKHVAGLARLQKRNAALKRIEVTIDELRTISALTTPNQALAVAKMPTAVFNESELLGRYSLVLDEVRVPGNLGTLIRIADWFGIEHIICSTSSVEVYNPKVVQSTMGSLFRVQVHYVDLPTFLSKTKDELPIIGAFLDGDSLYKSKLPKAGLILLGNESKGISKDLLPYVSQKVLIPKSPESHAESLNVAVAAGIICSETLRSRI